MARERPSKCKPAESCNLNLFLGFFLDGTRNNYGESIANKRYDHSNVARLYSCFPGKSINGVVPGEPKWEHEPDQYTNFFRIYTPGVGSAFDLVDDGGKGIAATLGGAAAYKGEARIIWTLLQAINAIHRFFQKDTLLVSASEARDLYKTISLNKLTLQEMTEYAPESYLSRSARKAFEDILKRLHRAIANNMHGPDGSKPKATDPALVQEIYVSAFGFSRGAAAARVFANWLVALCKLDALLLKRPGHTLGGFPVNFDFLGLFDTVASVGLANTLNTANGHWGWADAELSLRVPHEFKECLHLVAGHEVRRSFPLDSICYNNGPGAGRSEIVYPGVHSDVGGGYNPKEHGKGKDPKGIDMLSRLPLAHMYRAARLAGVPLKLDLVKQESVKEDFRIAPETINAFNQYLSHARTTTGTLTEVMREQCKFYILWRKMRRHSGPTPLAKTRSFEDARPEDRNDLRCANEEFEEEIAEYERWRDDYLNPVGNENDPRTWAQTRRDRKSIPVQPPGFRNRRENEWMEITRFWGEEVLPAGMEKFFDDYVHDSRAAFKLTGREASEVKDYLESLVRMLVDHERNPHADHRVDPLTPEERKLAEIYMKTGKVPEMKSDGREPLSAGAGYLRYRKIYAGADDRLISQRPHYRPGTRSATLTRKPEEEAA
ncbi:MAG TPA: DUF2235 domain-containing protein [Noviherbaspirillum sp.]|nr:DUF2235 domain-containing protein [Noviherbaspirillum sp.]